MAGTGGYSFGIPSGVNATSFAIGAAAVIVGVLLFDWIDKRIPKT